MMSRKQSDLCVHPDVSQKHPIEPEPSHKTTDEEPTPHLGLKTDSLVFNFSIRPFYLNQVPSLLLGNRNDVFPIVQAHTIRAEERRHIICWLFYNTEVHNTRTQHSCPTRHAASFLSIHEILKLDHVLLDSSLLRIMSWVTEEFLRPRCGYSEVRRHRRIFRSH